MLEVLDVCVGPRENLGRMAVLPAHSIRRSAILAEDVNDLAVAVRLSEVVAANDEPIARICPQYGVIAGLSAI